MCLGITFSNRAKFRHGVQCWSQYPLLHGKRDIQGSSCSNQRRQKRDAVADMLEMSLFKIIKFFADNMRNGFQFQHSVPLSPGSRVIASSDNRSV